jgi:hypothetical protein
MTKDCITFSEESVVVMALGDLRPKAGIVDG